ncbi:MAG TPA: AAA family ATPase [Polyangium sp.]|nr:AAA family ATPase [Polyangium sp.]
MITEFHIKCFKRFSSCELALKPLTILTGLNGAGKSTIIQAILLAREASMANAKTVALNGPYGLELGSPEDVFNLQSAVDSPEIELNIVLENGTENRFILDASNDQLQYLPIKSKPQHTSGALTGTNRNFEYLCAERFGPRDVLAMTAQPVDDLGEGVKGSILESRNTRGRSRLT